jgi:hypothetical protein
MKSINLKVVKEEINGVPTVLTTHALLRMAVNSPEQGGYDIDEMMKRLRLLEKIDAFKDKFTIKDEKQEPSDEFLATEATLELEDSDFEKLKSLFTKMKWGVLCNYIIELNEELKQAQ